MENREMPILHELMSFDQILTRRVLKVFVCRYLPTDKKFLFSVTSVPQW
jgi:hypothetical protein